MLENEASFPLVRECVDNLLPKQQMLEHSAAELRTETSFAGLPYLYSLIRKRHLTRSMLEHSVPKKFILLFQTLHANSPI